MAEIRIEHNETEHQHLSRLAGGEVRELLGKLAADLIRHGVDAARVDQTVGHLFGALTGLDGDKTTSLVMVLQSLRNIHRPVGTSLRSDKSFLSPNELLHIALHGVCDARYALMAAEYHPLISPPVLAMVKHASTGCEALLRQVQTPMWATDPPDATDMEPVGNA